MYFPEIVLRQPNIALVKILRLVVLFYSQKKKKKTVFIFIYNFYFKNLIYKLIKQFENQQKSDSIF